MIRCGLIAAPARHRPAMAWAEAIAVQFASLSTRWFALSGGGPVVPPGSSFVAELEAMPLGFFDVLALDPEIPDAVLVDLGGTIADRAAPGAVAIGSERQLALLGAIRRSAGLAAFRRPAAGAPVVTAPVRAPARWPGLAAWCNRRTAALATVLADDRSRPAAARLGRLDDLVLEAIDAHADRLFGQVRRRVVDALDEALPAGPWRAVPAPSTAPVGVGSEPGASQDGTAAPAGAGAAKLAERVGDWARRGTKLGGVVAQVLDARSAPPPGVAVYGNDHGFVAAAILEACGGRVGPVHDVEIVAGALSLYMAVYRELRPLLRGRAFFRWLATGDRHPEAGLVVLAKPHPRLLEEALCGLDAGGARAVTIVAEGADACAAAAQKFGEPVRAEPRHQIAVYRRA